MCCCDQLQRWYLSLAGVHALPRPSEAGFVLGRLFGTMAFAAPQDTHVSLWGYCAPSSSSKNISSSTWYHSLFISLHPPDLCLTQVLLEARVEVAPPLEEHCLADQFEPRCELERLVLEHGLQLVLGNERAVTDFVGVDVEVDIGLDEEDVVN
jgi:hypothetical protein